MSGKHAILSASAAHRWAACPGSARLTADIPPRASEYALAGTLAHEIAARCLARPSDQLVAHGPLDPRQWLGETMARDGFEATVDEEMLNAVQVYLDAIRGDLRPFDEVKIEVDLTPALQTVHPLMGGTADFVRYRPLTKELLVRDFKYGSGVLVAAEDNLQLRIYALGAALSHNKPIASVTVVVDQPRIDHPEGASRAWTFHVRDLLDFMVTIREAADATQAADAPLVPGKVQCGFCPARRTCPALEAAQNALVDAHFGAVEPYDPADLARALSMIEPIKARIKALEEFAYQEAYRGVAIPGWKLVEKRAVRRWTNEAAVVEWAEHRAIDPYEPRKLKTPAQMESGLSKVEKQSLATLVERVSNGYALVPETDPRAPVALLPAPEFPAVPSPHSSDGETFQL